MLDDVDRRLESALSAPRHRRRAGSHEEDGGQNLAQRYIPFDDFYAAHVDSEGRRYRADHRTGRPIPMPLYPGESVERYERAFCHWLVRQTAQTMEELACDPRNERIRRFEFANWRVHTAQRESSDRRPSSDQRKRSRSQERSSGVGSDRRRLGDLPLKSPRYSSVRGSASDDDNLKPSTRNRSSSATRSTAFRDSGRPDDRHGSCCRRKSGSGGSVECYCADCLPRWASRLMHRLDEAERNEKRMLRRIYELEEQVHALQRQGNASNDQPIKTEKDLLSRIGDDNEVVESHAGDLIRARLTAVYDKLNDEILLNEKAVDDSMQLVRNMMDVDMGKALELQTQIQALRVAIEQESGKRDAAVAVLIAHVWDGKRGDLVKLFTPLAALNVPLAQRSSHAKCAAVSREIKAVNDEIAASTRTLASELRINAASPVKLERSDQLTANPSRMNDVAARVAEMEVLRDRLELEKEAEYLALFHSSKHVRSLVQTQLKQTQRER